MTSKVAEQVLWRRVSRQGKRLHRRVGGRTRRLAFERLDARQMFALVSWIGGSGDWNDGSHWDNGTGPAVGDDVLLNVPGVTVTHSSGTHDLRSLNVHNTFALTGGRLRISTNGTSVLASDFIVSGGLLLGPIATTGNMLWTGGDLGGGVQPFIGEVTLVNTGIITRTAQAGKFRGSLTNSGFVSDAAGVTPFEGSSVKNLLGGIYDIAADVNAPDQFWNYGVIRKSGGSGTATIPLFHSLSGTVDVRSGTLSINGGPVSEGQGETWIGGNFQVASNAFLDILGSTPSKGFAMTGRYTGSGAGTVRYRGDVLKIGAVGETIFSNGAHVTEATSFNFVDGPFAMHGSSIDASAATLTNLGVMALEGPATTILSGRLKNSGTLGLKGEQIFTGSGLVGNVFENTGTLRKSSGAGTSTLAFGAQFQSIGGAIDVVAGTLEIADGTYVGGKFSAAATAILKLVGFPTLSGQFSGSGLGAVQLGASIRDIPKVGTTGATFNFPSGLFQWTAGLLDATGGLTNLGSLTITGPERKRLGGSLINAGVIVHQGNHLENYSDSSITNLASAVYDFRADFAVGLDVFINRGTLKKSNGSGISSMQPRMFRNEGGVIDVQTGTLQIFSGNEISTGAMFKVATGATLDLTGFQPTHYTGIFSGSGAGVVRLDSGMLIIGDTGATFNFPEGMLQWTAGTLDGGTLGLNNTGYITLAGSEVKFLQGRLKNAGTVLHAGSGNLDFYNAVFDNLAGATYELRGDIDLQRGALDSSRFNNAGTLRKSSGTGDSTNSFGVQFNNLGGTIDVRAGSFLMKGDLGTRHTGGLFHVSAGSALDLTGGSFFASAIFEGTYVGSGEGLVVLRGGTLSAGTGGAIFNFPNGMFQWTGGTLDGLNAPLLNRGSISLPSFGRQILMGALHNAGTISIVDEAGIAIRGEGGKGVFTNLPGGVFEFSGDGGVIEDLRGDGGGATFINQGILRKSLGPGTATIKTPMFSNDGTMDVAGGTFRIESPIVSQVTGSTLIGGKWQASGGGSIELVATPPITSNKADVSLRGPGSRFAKLEALRENAGSLSLLDDRDLTTVGALSNSGSISMGAGSTLRIAGAFEQTATGKLTVQLGGSSESGQYGRLRSDTAAALGGRFNVELTNGFGPASGQIFEVMTFPDHTGNFSDYGGLRLGRFPLFKANLVAQKLTLEAVSNSSDLAFETFDLTAFPASVKSGQNVELKYSVKNLSDLPAVGDWIDSLYLSSDGTLDASDVVLSRVRHEGGLSPKGSYSRSVQAALPALPLGNYRVIVLADSRGLVSDADRTNNAGVSALSFAISVPLLTLGVPLSGTIAPGEELYYRLLVPPGRDVTLDAQFASTPGADLSIRYGALPDAMTFDDASRGGLLHPKLLLTNPQGGTYYLALRARADASGLVPFTLQATNSTYEITHISPLKGSNLGQPAIVELKGSQLTSQTMVQLRMAGGESRPALAVNFIDSNHIVATFDLKGLPVGGYQVVAEEPGKSAVAFDRFTVTSNPPGETGAFIWLKTLSTVAIASTAGVRSNRQQRIAFGEFNTSDSPLPAPLYVIKATNVHPDQEVKGSLGSDRVPPRMLPGDYFNSDVQVIAYKPAVVGPHVTSSYSLYSVEPTQTLLKWDLHKAKLRPSTISADAWDAVWKNLRPNLGDTLADFWQLLTTNAEHLMRSREHVVAIDRLFTFELQKANNLPAVPVAATAMDIAFPAPGLPVIFGRSFGATISDRFQQGRLGRGWNDNFDISIHEVSANRSVSVIQGGRVRYFQGQPDGSYIGAQDEFATLSKQQGVFRLRETSGEVIAFHADGSLDFLSDSNGNRITASHSGNQLTKLTHSSGAELSLSYSMGRLQQVTDPSGRVSNYEYDSSGEHLIRVSTLSGNYEYTYTSETTGPRAHALASITYPNGSHLYFDYDSHGRLVRQQGDGGAGLVRFEYDVASFTSINALNQRTSYFYDDSFQVRRVVNPLGQVSTIDRDLANRSINVNDAGGGEARVSFDAFGNPVSTVNTLGEVQSFTYGADLSSLAKWHDALGRETQFNRDARGNLATAIYVDGSTERSTYDGQGNLLSNVNRLGQKIEFTYNSSGQVVRKKLPDGTHVDYAYTARGNLETVVDATGTTRLVYGDVQDPDLLTKITYPNGRYLEYAYQNGRRVRMSDQSGFVTNYQYDTMGRLAALRDGAGSRIVGYEYDPVGRLVRESRGNGTLTDYTYDVAGQTTGISNRAPGGALQSEILYAYDNLGRRASMKTAEGITTYGYDGVGRLTSVRLPQGRVIAYAYDAAGNRMESKEANSTTTYVVNELNQYLSFGANSQTFDAAGNLISTITPAGSTSYQYDAEGRLVSQITPAGTWRYEYDFMGNRSASVHDGLRTEYLVDPNGLGNVVGEYDGNGNLQAHYVQGLGLTSRVDNSGAAFYQFDAVGNTTELTDAAGAVVNTYRYLPFGEKLVTSETIANPFEYVGRFGVMREASGIDYMRNRWYAPTQGRFTQSDPIGLAGGTNFYAYVSNNPVNFIDPSGLVSSPAEYAAFEAARSWWKAYDAARIAARALSPPVGSAPPGTGPSTQVWNPSVSADPLARTTYVNPPNYSQFAAQVERAAAEQAAKAARGPTALRAGLWAILAAEAIAIGVVVGQGLETYNTGEIAPCLPGIPADLQACENPGSGILEEILELKFIQRLVTEQVNPAEDPNDIIGPVGYGPEGFVIPQAPLGYTINFQNKPEAVGPAAEVVVALNLDPNLDLDTFELGEFGFAELTITLPTGRQYYKTRIDLRSTHGVFVDVIAELDRVNRRATWTFQAIDPETFDLPSDPTVGFLPPDKTAPEGQGFVSFSARPRSNISSGSRITAQASIVFDTNPAIVTNTTVNTIDAGVPTSAVAPLPALQNRTFVVNWAGADEPGGSGIATFDVWASDNGAPFSLWQNSTKTTSAVFTGQAGHTYRFYSTAKDNLGHTEVQPPGADSVTTVSTKPWQNALNPLDVNRDNVVSAIDVLLIINRLNARLNGPLPAEHPVLEPSFDTSGDNTLSPIDALLVINELNTGRRLVGKGENRVTLHASEVSGWANALFYPEMNVTQSFHARTKDKPAVDEIRDIAFDSQTANESVNDAQDWPERTIYERDRFFSSARTASLATDSVEAIDTAFAQLNAKVL